MHDSSDSGRQNLRWSQRDKKAAFANRAAKSGSDTGVGILVKRHPWGERIRIKKSYPKGSFKSPHSPADTKQPWSLSTGLWVRQEFHNMAVLSSLIPGLHKTFLLHGGPKWILCLSALNSFKEGNISCRSRLSFPFEVTETWVSLAKFPGLPCWGWSNQSKWIRSKMSKSISIQLITILQSCSRAKKVHSPVLNQDIITKKCSKLNTFKNCLTHVSHLILDL